MSKNRTPPRGYHFYCKDCGFHQEVPTKEDWMKLKKTHKGPIVLNRTNQDSPVSGQRGIPLAGGKACPLFRLPDGSQCREDLLSYLIPLTSPRRNQEGKDS